MKRLLTAIFLLSVLLTSCESSTKDPYNHEEVEGVVLNDSVDSKYIAKGKVIKIDKQGLHVQDKDKVDVYNVDYERIGKIYVGEYVTINKLNEVEFDVALDTDHDYSVRTTTDGKEVTRISGAVKEVDKDNIVVTTDERDIKLSRARDFDLESGDQLMVDYIKLAGRNQMLAFYDEASKISVAVIEISRDINGMMRIYALSDSNVEYDIVVGADTVTDFRHSSLNKDDRIFIYPNNISGDVPALVDAKLILLQENEE
jgi:hypothetical protein